MAEAEARLAAEAVARDHYGRLVALVTRATGDPAGAEEALSEAFLAALRVWPVAGVPHAPQAWMLVAARRAAGKQRRHDTVRGAAQAALAQLAEERAEAAPETLGDARLRLLFLCAHPAIAADNHTPLMLQTVLGLDAARIGAAFLVPPATMAQRLVRAKAKIRVAGIPFALPDPSQLPARLAAVLAAIHAAFTAGWDDVGLGQAGHGSLTAEAIFLARLLASLMPDQAEVRGLLALMLFAEARATARRGLDGAYVPLSQQDRSLWRDDLIAEAEAELRAASALAAPGRYQTEAAIQSLHVSQGVPAAVRARVLCDLYAVLEAQAPSVGVRLARAVALAAAGEVVAGLALLDDLPGAAMAAHQPWWAARAHLLALAGQAEAARAARAQAIALARDPAVAAWLRQAER